MCEQRDVNSHYAILIGIDAYPNGPLNSCVRDVQAIKECLESQLSFVDIQTFTASNSRDPDIATPLEDPDRWPTLRNVASGFGRTTSRANKGDFVYVHYSGHGTRLAPCFDFSNSSTGDLALVLLKAENSPEVFLRGPRLAGLLKAMVDKGLIVTVVLDCCFSASVYRNGDPNVRYLPCGPAVAPTYSLRPDNNSVGRGTRFMNRDATMRDNWLLDPDRYTILAACGPHENAKGGFELGGNGERYGALSLFLSRAFSNRGLGRKHKDIHRHLCAKFWQSCVAQFPVLYGNVNQGFFGSIDLCRNTRSYYVVEREGSLQLLAGRAHGLHDGERFTVYPPNSASDRSVEEESIVTIARVGAFTSQLDLSGIRSNYRTQWIAEPRTSLYHADFLVRLSPDIPHHNEWLAALKERSFRNIDGAQTPVYQVVLSSDNEYEILDSSSRKITNLPPMPEDRTDIGRICNVLEHLARFEMVKGLTNETPTETFRKSFDIHIISQGKIFGPGEQIEVRHNSIIEVIMKNVGETVLYIHVYNLGPCWQVKGIYHGTYEAVPPRKVRYDGQQAFAGRSSRKIKMTIPVVMQEYGSCEDVIKIFVTTHPTIFDSLELPNLDELVGINTGERISHPDNQLLEDWVALNFPIRTSL
ncbi:putative caspase [Truncatella angustata]|uniref:Caspase n=1 Tax=Truncatella angustata TaxID=152316 RepID=A0A9P8UIQ0_9PEZI|nr:putative caspase [Truncatella angustata]KAH6652851.1 putative caspase [Truncatella angustata]KAH8202263.1 hypothetical protein TruAng_003540 [Truncatella angustata]